MDEILFDEEGIKFKYLSNWKEQRKDVIGQNCIKALVKVVEENPSTITVYKNEAGDKENVEDLESDMKKGFESQGWTIVDSKVLSLNGNDIFNIISNAQEGGKTLELQVSALLNNGYMYIFELMNFKEFSYAYNDYLAILDSIEF